MVTGRAGLHGDGAKLERGQTSFFENTGLSELKSEDGVGAAGKPDDYDAPAR